VGEALNLKPIIPEMISTPAKLFLFGGILNGIGNGIFNVVIQFYFTSIGYSSSVIGSIFIMNAISAAVLTLPMGILADRYGKRKMILLGTFTTFISIILMMTSRSIEMYMVSFLGIGVTNVAAVVFSPLYSSFFDNGDLDRAFGLWGCLNIVTMSIGSLLGFIPPFLVQNFGYSTQASYWTFMAVGSFFFLSQYFFYLMSTRGMTKPVNDKGFKLTLTSKDLIMKFSLITLISSASFGIFLGLFPYYVNKKFSIQSDALGTIFFVSNFVSARAQAMAPRVSKKLGAVKTMALSIGLATPFYLMMPFMSTFTFLSVLYIVRLGFAALAQPLMSSTFMKHLRDEEKSTANSIRMMSMQGGNVIGPWLGGQLMERTSLDLPAWVGDCTLS
jgi:MFS family permease